MRPQTLFLLAFAAVLVAPSVGAAQAVPEGYIGAGQAPKMIWVLPPPPEPGSGVDADDRKAFRDTRSLEGSPRWTLAINDAAQSPEAAFLDFACALGVTLDDGTAPVLSNLLARVGVDAGQVVTPTKDRYNRKRPYLVQPGNICVERSDLLAASPSYPSGHSTLSWAWALILAELAPDRSTEILERARAYAESRVVCGVHYPSDIEAGRTNGSALVAALHGSARFRADMDKAREEVAAARKSRASAMQGSGQCKVEQDAEEKRPW